MTAVHPNRSAKSRVQFFFDFSGNLVGRGWAGAPLGPRLLGAFRRCHRRTAPAWPTHSEPLFFTR